MRRFLSGLNPTLRGLLILALIALVVVVFQLQTTVSVVSMLLSIAFFLAIAFFLYLVWRERREEIGGWSTRARVVFYGAALLIVADLAVYFWQGLPGYDALAFIVVLLLAAFSMFRVWRDQHTYESARADPLAGAPVPAVSPVSDTASRRYPRAAGVPPSCVTA